MGAAVGELALRLGLLGQPDRPGAGEQQHQAFGLEEGGVEGEGADGIPGVFRYAHIHEHFMEDMIHSSRLLTFYERVSFIGMVSKYRVVPASKHERAR